jgi:phosphoglycerate kinase
LGFIFIIDIIGIGEGMKTLNEMDLRNKRVIIRCDYNVSIKNGVIEDDTRIRKSLNTLNYLINNHCKIIILSHLGRIKSEEDKSLNSLEIVAKYLSKLINKDVTFINACYGTEVKKIVDNRQLGEIIMLENTRFMDYPQKLESENNLVLAKFWSSLADVFVMDAFGSAHRVHSSTAGISNYLPTCVGLLVQNELTNLNPLIEIRKRPFIVFMGGAKINDKLPIIKQILPKCDMLLVGGGVANSFLKVSGTNVGNSLATNDEAIMDDLRSLLIKFRSKIVLPIDYVKDNNNAIMDIGEQSINNFARYITNSQLVFMNGTPGMFEEDKYAIGTKTIFRMLEASGADVYLGGGDTLNAAKKFNYDNKFKYQSSGGGATLEYIANGHLDAIDYINKNMTK